MNYINTDHLFIKPDLVSSSRTIDRNNPEVAAKDFAQFTCYKLAETFTKALKSESFEQEMMYSRLADALGTLLGESNIGLALQESVDEALNPRNKNIAPSVLYSNQKLPLNSSDSQELYTEASAYEKKLSPQGLPSASQPRAVPSYVAPTQRQGMPVEDYIPQEMLEAEKWIA